MLTFKPKTDDEIQREMLIPEGEYNFEVSKAIEKISKAGNPMIELTIKIWDHEGKEKTIYDYLMTGKPAYLYKIKHFCYSIGKGDLYENGKISDVELMGGSGKLILVIRDSKDNYPPRNAVKDYIVNENKTNENEDKFDDDLPF